jgi:CheY-like chemotaxis protein
VIVPSIPRVARYAPTSAVTPRKVWILGCDSSRVGTAVSYLMKKGHDARGGEPGGDVGAALRTERPDLVVIDMETDGDRGRHVAVQLRADRGTRQLPIVLVGVRSSDGPKVDRAVPGPTRRYAGTLVQPTVLEAIYKDL